LGEVLGGVGVVGEGREGGEERRGLLKEMMKVEGGESMRGRRAKSKMGGIVGEGWRGEEGGRAAARGGDCCQEDWKWRGISD